MTSKIGFLNLIRFLLLSLVSSTVISLLLIILGGFNYWVYGFPWFQYAISSDFFPIFTAFFVAILLARLIMLLAERLLTGFMKILRNYPLPKLRYETKYETKRIVDLVIVLVLVVSFLLLGFFSGSPTSLLLNPLVDFYFVMAVFVLLMVRSLFSDWVKGLDGADFWLDDFLTAFAEDDYRYDSLVRAMEIFSQSCPMGYSVDVNAFCLELNKYIVMGGEEADKILSLLKKFEKALKKEDLDAAWKSYLLVKQSIAGFTETGEPTLRRRIPLKIRMFGFIKSKEVSGPLLVLFIAVLLRLTGLLTWIP